MNTQQTNKRRLGILVCGHSPEKVVNEYGRYNTIFEKLLGPEQYTYHDYFVVDNKFPTSINDADAWLITGSKHGAYDPLPWISPLEDFIREVYAANLPMVGICFGHQILAQALGGRVVKHKGGWIAGTQHYTFSDEIGIDKVILNAWHQDQVVELAAGSRAIGSSDTCGYAAIAYRDNTVSLQPHPEFENDYLTLLLSERGDALPADLRQAAADSIGQNLTNKQIANWLNQALSGGTSSHSG